jgi:flavin-binding protein dodecin
VAGTNGKSERRERIKQAASFAAQAASDTIKPVSTTQVIDVEHPIMIGATGREIDTFDVHDKRPRLMFLLETLTDEEAKARNGQAVILHTLRWNCDSFSAHSIAVDGVGATRGLELADVQAYQRQLIESQTAQAAGQEEGSLNEADASKG